LNLTTPEINNDEKELLKGDLKGIWIEKPVHASQGVGISLVEDIVEYRKKFLNKKPEKALPYERLDRNSYILQKYIHPIPLLDGRKFDIRCYLVIPSSFPFMALYADGYVRRTMKEYKLSFKELAENKRAAMKGHLTNFAV